MNLITFLFGFSECATVERRNTEMTIRQKRFSLDSSSSFDDFDVQFDNSDSGAFGTSFGKWDSESSIAESFPNSESSLESSGGEAPDLEGNNFQTFEETITNKESRFFKPESDYQKCYNCR